MAYARVPADEDLDPEASTSGPASSALPLAPLPDNYYHEEPYNPYNAPTPAANSQDVNSTDPYAYLPTRDSTPHRLPYPDSPEPGYSAPEPLPSRSLPQTRPWESAPEPTSQQPTSRLPYRPSLPLPQPPQLPYQPGYSSRFYSAPGAPIQPYPQPSYSAPPQQLPQIYGQQTSSAPQPLSQPYVQHSYSAPQQQISPPYVQQTSSAPQPLSQTYGRQSYSTPAPGLGYYPSATEPYPQQHSDSYPLPYETAPYTQQYPPPQNDPYTSVHDFADSAPLSQSLPSAAIPPQTSHTRPTIPTRPNTDAAQDVPTEQSGTGSRGSPAARVWVQDGSASNSFFEADALSKYLGLFPEADNDQGCRAFRFGPECATTLLMPLLGHLDFSRFSQFPYGLSGNFSVRDEWGSGSCTCDRCYSGQLCGHYMLSKNFEFYLPLESMGPASPSPKVETEAGLMSISAGASRYDFYAAVWNIQLFRFRSRRTETSVFSYDALIYQNYELEARARGTPLDYIFDQLEVILDGWNSVLTASSQFLSSFRVEVLEERLSKDRSVVRSLVVAAQHWEGYRKVLNTQLQRLQFLEDVFGDPRWTEGRDNHFETLSFASTYLQKFRAIDFRIQTELIQETDSLIQRVTNLISIDEGYRSRDQNESIRRLTWITFIFLPLLFTSALFSMQLDLFNSPAPWQYYIYASLVLMTLVFLGYAVLRSRRRFVFACKFILVWPVVALLNLAVRVLQKLGAEKPTTDGTDIEKQSTHAADETATILKWAASSGNVDVLRNILQTASSKDKPTSPGASGEALITAIRNGHTEAANLLIGTKLGLLYQDTKGATPLHWAAKGGHSTICQTLLQNGAEKNGRTLTGETALDWAMEGGDERTINLLLKGDKKFTRLDTLNLQSLHFSARIGDLNMVKDLHRKGSSLEMRDGKGQTVLFHAVKGGQQSIVKWLLKEGKANVQAIDKEGFTPLHIAAQVADEKLVLLLIKHGANVNALSNMHLTPLHMIAVPSTDALRPISETNGPRVLALLCENGANINMQSRDDNRITHEAARAGKVGMKLLEAASAHGADLNAQGAAGNTPAHCAAACGCQPSLEFLASKAVDIVDSRNAAGYTPLMTAAQAGQTAAMVFLLDQGASYSVADAEGRSLVELSIGWGNPAVMATLRGRGAEYGELAEDDHPVWEAVRDGQPGAVLEQLLAGGLSVQYARGDVSLLQLALESGNAEAAAILLERGAVVDAVDSYGWTALHSAAFGGQVAPLLLVLQRARDRAPKDNQGWTPLNIAAFYKHEEAEKVLDPEGKMDRFGPMREPTMRSGVEATEFMKPLVLNSVVTNVAEAPGD